LQSTLQGLNTSLRGILPVHPGRTQVPPKRFLRLWTRFTDVATFLGDLNQNKLHNGTNNKSVNHFIAGTLLERFLPKTKPKTTLGSTHESPVVHKENKANLIKDSDGFALSETSPTIERLLDDLQVGKLLGLHPNIVQKQARKNRHTCDPARSALEIPRVGARSIEASAGVAPKCEVPLGASCQLSTSRG
jgi:hypothetical protein